MHNTVFTTLRQRLAMVGMMSLLAAQSWAGDSYRAEIVVIERLADPLLMEDMAARQPQSVDAVSRLLELDADGAPLSDINLVNGLTLDRAAARLANSGKYRVLMKAGWVQDFPPDYRGEPMRIEVGEYLSRAGHREVEGTIEINRRRYLLVDVRLNHWREKVTEAAQSPAPEATPTIAETNPIEASPEDGEDLRSGEDAVEAIEPEADAHRELVTWIRETRRMRSEEIHFLDSPTIGVLVYFRPMD